MGGRRERDDDVPDAVLAHHALEIPARSEHRQRVVAVVERLLVEKADRAQPGLRVLLEAAGRELSDPAGSDDERGQHGAIVAPGAGERPREAHAPRR